MRDQDVPSSKVVILLLTIVGQYVFGQTPDGAWNTWDYCGTDVKCDPPNQIHTVCERKHKCDPVDDCMEHTTDTFRDLMVKLHNEKRNFVALGRHNKNNVKRASNMRTISYDYSLEYTIRCHINRCKGTKHDKCRGTAAWVPVSQNLCGHTLWNKSATLDKNIEALSILCVDLWFNESYYEGADFSKIIPSYDELNVKMGKTGHFTAIVWALTSHMGCHFTRDTVKKQHSEMGSGYEGLYSFVGCNYGIGGNEVGRPMYRVGNPCTRCPKGVRCNPEYKGLCGQVKFVADIQRGGFLGSKKGVYVWVTAAVVGSLVVVGIAGILIYKFVIDDQ